ncbi:MAG TPA: bacteriohopanetetrol glucosamine biosynthesis glycosyltransferase HpnI [Magnetospirillaceae bacterium]
MAVVLAAAALIGCVYQIAAAILTVRYMRTHEPTPSARPGISVLKPLHGDEPGLADNLRALCRLDYPAFQILCNTLDPIDPAWRVAEQVRAEFPAVAMQNAAGEGSAARNRKIASLENLLPRATHDILAFADADVGAAPLYLDNIAAALEKPGAGLVTCLYLAQPTGTLWSQLESQWINLAFLPSVLVARAIGRRDGCFGATIALHRATLDRVGGLAPLRDLLADDFALGAAVRELGLTIELAARPVDMVVHHNGFMAMFTHEVRWGRTIAVLDRFGYAASILTQPVILGLAAALLGGLAWPFVATFLGAGVVRYLAVRAQERALGVTPAPAPLLALREVLTFAVFVAALWGRTVHWRGSRYRIHRDGTMQSVEESPS